jgi:deazaflavin-dependent oxidoreductase (nitroreductase family)
MRIMGAANAAVAAVLRSPLHGLLSGSTCLVQYTGQRSHDRFTTPTRYARHGDDVVILVGRPPSKTWWRNFRDERDIDVLLRRRWHEMTARAVVGADDPAQAAALLAAYLGRYPKALRALGEDTAAPSAHGVVMVSCRPR